MYPWAKSYTFQYEDYWNEQLEKYKAYLETCINRKTLFIGLDIGNMTPEIIKHPFMEMTYNFKDARCAFINIDVHDPMPQIANKTIAINADIKDTLEEMVRMRNKDCSQ